MTQLQVSLPESANRYIAEQIASGRYQSPDEVLADLVERARIEAAKDKLAELILEGESSGEGIEYTRESWEAVSKKLAELVREALDQEGEEIEFTSEWWDRRTTELREEAERRRGRQPACPSRFGAQLHLPGGAKCLCR